MQKILLVVLFIVNIFAQDIDIDVKINEDLSTKHLAFFEFTFTNNSQDWEKITQPKISFGDIADKNIKILTAEELETYFDYLKESQNDSSSNKNLFTTALGLINPLTLFATIPEANQKEFASTGDTYPKGHLYHKSILIPPGIKIKRFLVVSSKNHKDYGYLNSLKFNEKTLAFRGLQYEERDSPIGDKIKTKRNYIWQSDIQNVSSSNMDDKLKRNNW